MAQKTTKLATLPAADGGFFFIRPREDGRTLTSYRRHLVLREELDQVYKVPGTGGEDGDGKKRVEKWQPTAVGYHYINRTAGVSILTPRTVIKDGKETMNPHIERDPESGLTLSVTIRKIGLGRTESGNLAAVDQTLTLNPKAYLMRDLQNFVKWGKAYAIQGVDAIMPKGKGDWVFYPIMPPVGIWVDIAHKDIQRQFSTLMEITLFAERRAQTICERNVLKRHPAIALSRLGVKALPNGQHVGEVVVTGWADDDKLFKDIEKAALMLEQGKAPEDVTVTTAAGEAIEEEEDDPTVVDDAGEAEVVEPEPESGSSAQSADVTPKASGGPQEAEEPTPRSAPVQGEGGEPPVPATPPESSGPPQAEPAPPPKPKDPSKMGKDDLIMYCTELAGQNRSLYMSMAATLKKEKKFRSFVELDVATLRDFIRSLEVALKPKPVQKAKE